MYWCEGSIKMMSSSDWTVYQLSHMLNAQWRLMTPCQFIGWYSMSGVAVAFLPGAPLGPPAYEAWSSAVAYTSFGAGLATPSH